MKFLNPNLSDEENDVPEKSRELTEAEELSSAAEKEEKAPRAGIVSALRAWVRSHKRIAVAIGVCLLLLVHLLPLMGTVFRTETADGVTYSYDWATGQYGVSGFDNSREEVTIPNYVGDIPVALIQEGAFRGCDRLRTVTLSSNIRYIAKDAFASTPNLSTVIALCERYEYTENFDVSDVHLAPFLQINPQAFGDTTTPPDIEISSYSGGMWFNTSNIMKRELLASYLSLWNLFAFLGSVGYFIYAIAHSSARTHVGRMILAGAVIILTTLPPLFTLAAVFIYGESFSIRHLFYPTEVTTQLLQLLVLPIGTLIASFGLTFLQDPTRLKKVSKGLFFGARGLALLVVAFLFPLLFPEMFISSAEALLTFRSWARFLLESNAFALLSVLCAASNVLFLVQMRRAFWHSRSCKAAFGVFLPSAVLWCLSIGTITALHNFLNHVARWNQLEPIRGTEEVLFSLLLLLLFECLAWVAFFLIRRGEKRTQGAIHSEEEVHQ